MTAVQISGDRFTLPPFFGVPIDLIRERYHFCLSRFLTVANPGFSQISALTDRLLSRFKRVCWGTSSDEKFSPISSDGAPLVHNSSRFRTQVPHLTVTPLCNFPEVGTPSECVSSSAVTPASPTWPHLLDLLEDIRRHLPLLYCCSRCTTSPPSSPPDLRNFLFLEALAVTRPIPIYLCLALDRPPPPFFFGLRWGYFSRHLRLGRNSFSHSFSSPSAAETIVDSGSLPWSDPILRSPLWQTVSLPEPIQSLFAVANDQGLICPLYTRFFPRVGEVRESVPNLPTPLFCGVRPDHGPLFLPLNCSSSPPLGPGKPTPRVPFRPFGFRGVPFFSCSLSSLPLSHLKPFPYRLTLVLLEDEYPLRGLPPYTYSLPRSPVCCPGLDTGLPFYSPLFFLASPPPFQVKEALLPCSVWRSVFVDRQTSKVTIFSR